MKKTSLFGLALVLSGVFSVLSCNDKTADEKPAVNTPAANFGDAVKRGEYLVSIMGCDDCHTPKKMGANGPELDMEKRLSGHPAQMPLGSIKGADLKSWVLFNHTTTAFVGPWGVSYAANLTSDASGVGNWTESQFLKAIREGKFKGLDSSRPLLPPMPWPAFKNATDDDLKAIFAYLRSVKPVSNVVPTNVTPDKLATLK